MTTIMKKIVMLFIIMMTFQACENQKQISYYKTDGIIHFNNTAINLAIDKNMKIKTSYIKNGKLLSIASEQSKPNDFLIMNGKEVYEFKIEKTEYNKIENEFGEGNQLRLFGKSTIAVGESKADIEKILTIELYNNLPNAAITYADYINLSDKQLKIDKIVGDYYTVDRKQIDSSKKSYDFSLFQGCGVNWGLNYCNIKVDSVYYATNFMGIIGAHRDPKGGGIPLLDLWGKKMGMAIAQISAKPEFVNLPIHVMSNGKIEYGIEELYSRQNGPISLEKNKKYSTLKQAVIVHSLDYFDALRTYAQILNYQGIKTFKETPNTVPQAYWKTWGYELNFKLSDIYAKLPEFKQLGIEMIVLDDGWFSNYGDWEPNTHKGKFPNGREDLKKFINDMHKENFKVGVWWCPLIAEPDSKVAKTHPDWFMQKKDGTPYIMKDPVSYFLCPDYAPVINYWEEQIEKLYKTFGVDYVYHDWANLIEVPACYNPSHKHKSPLSSYWNLSNEYKHIYEKVQSIKPGFGIEMCECGRPHDPYKMPYYNITNASDATTKEQVRQRLKVEKALNGSKVYFNPGYILPEQKADWGYDPCEIDECVAMGGYFETYYTELTPEKKKEWIKWLKIYREEEIYKGEYLNLYDIEFDKPETHVTKRNGIYYYFIVGPFDGELKLRGLEAKKYNISNLYSKEFIKKVDGPIATIKLKSNSNIYLKLEAIN